MLEIEGEMEEDNKEKITMIIKKDSMLLISFHIHNFSWHSPSQIDRASAGAMRRSKADKAADTEEEDEFGYTASEYT